MDLNENIFRIKQVMGLLEEQTQNTLPYVVEGEHTVPQNDSNPCDAFHGFQLQRNPSATMNVQVKNALDLFKGQGVWVSDVQLTDWDVNKGKVKWKVTIDKSSDGKFWNGFTSRGAGCNDNIDTRWDSESAGNGPQAIKTKITTEVKNNDGTIKSPKTCENVENIELVKKIEVLTQTPTSKNSAGNFSFIQGFYRYRCGSSSPSNTTPSSTSTNSTNNVSQVEIKHGARKVLPDGNTEVYDGYNKKWIPDTDWLKLYREKPNEVSTEKKPEIIILKPGIKM